MHNYIYIHNTIYIYTIYIHNTYIYRKYIYIYTTLLEKHKLSVKVDVVLQNNTNGVIQLLNWPQTLACTLKKRLTRKTYLLGVQTRPSVKGRIETIFPLKVVIDHLVKISVDKLHRLCHHPLSYLTCTDLRHFSRKGNLVFRI